MGTLHYTSEKVTKSQKFKHLCTCEPIDPLMVVLSACSASFIHIVLEGIMQIELMCTKYINYTPRLCKPLFEFLLLGFLFGNNSSTLLFFAMEVLHD